MVSLTPFFWSILGLELLMWIFSAIASAIVAAILFVLATVGVAVALVVFVVLFVVFTLLVRYRMKKAGTFESNGTRIIFYSTTSGNEDLRRQARKKAEEDGDLYELSPHEYSVEDVPEKPDQPQSLEERPAEPTDRR